jgi:hypothetical protein
MSAETFSLAATGHCQNHPMTILHGFNDTDVTSDHRHRLDRIADNTSPPSAEAIQQKPGSAAQPRAPPSSSKIRDSHRGQFRASRIQNSRLRIQFLVRPGAAYRKRNRSSIAGL